DTLAFLLLLSLLLPSLLIMFIPSTFKRPVSSWKALNLRKTLLMASSVRLKPLNCSRLPCVYAQETLTFLLTQKKTCVKNYVQKESCLQILEAFLWFVLITLLNVTLIILTLSVSRLLNLLLRLVAFLL